MRQLRSTHGLPTLAIAGGFALLAAGCQSRSANEVNNQVVTEAQIDEALDRHGDELLAVPGVQGAGRGECDGRPCIRVLVLERTPELRESVTAILEGYPVEIVETGEIQALDTSPPDP